MSNSSELHAQSVYTVTELCAELNGLLSGTYKNLYLRGEVSGLTRASSGHLYFTIKDDRSAFSAVMFRAAAQLLPVSIEEGNEFIFRGTVRIYDKRGQLQFECIYAEPAGAGAQHLALEKLKAKLEEEGLFDQTRKLPLPFLPDKIGIITSPSGAVIRDMLSVFARKFSGVPVLIYPVPVQGKEAIPVICEAVAHMDTRENCSVLIVARGGGSFEELMPFNDEALVRAVAGCRTPIISAVGHETDFSLCDFAADWRAATPTAAAEIAVPDRNTLTASVSESRSRLFRTVLHKLEQKQSAVSISRAKLTEPSYILRSHTLRLDDYIYELENRMSTRMNDSRHYLRENLLELKQQHPGRQIIQLHQSVSGILARLPHLFKNRLSKHELILMRQIDRLTVNSPTAVLKRGFVRVRTDKNNHKILSAKDIKVSQKIKIEMQDGIIKATADEVITPDRPSDKQTLLTE